MRRSVLFVSAVVGALTWGVEAFQERLPPNPDLNLDIEKISDRLYLVTGVPRTQPGSAYCPPNCRAGGGNTGVFLTASGVVLIDTKSPGWAPTIAAKVRTITDKPITTIINTHAHADHAAGDVFFPPSVDIVVHENAKIQMDRMDLLPQSPERAQVSFKGAANLRTRTFKDTLSLFSGADRIDLYYFGVGHSNSDTFVVIPSERVMFTGDIFPYEDAMVINRSTDGSGLAFPETMAKVLATIKGVDRIITGHSWVLPWAALERYQRFNSDLLTWALEARKRGQTVADAASVIRQRLFISGKYEGHSLFRVQNAVQAIYDELELKERFAGTWEIVQQPDAPDASSLAAGLIIYDPAGYMAFAATRDGRRKSARPEPTPQEARAALDSYTGSFGLFSVNGDTRLVTHHVQGDVNPAGSGSDQERSFQFLGMGNRLMLQPLSQAAVPVGGLIYERVPDVRELTPTHRRLVGFWKLVSNERRSVKGDLVSSNPGQIGVLLFTASGHMMVHMMQSATRKYAAAQPTPGELITALRTYESSFGQYTIHEDSLVHDPTGVLDPAGIGSKVQRFYEIAGNRLILKSPPIKLGSRDVQDTTTWERLSDDTGRSN